MALKPIDPPKAETAAPGFGLIETLVAMALVLLLVVGAAEMLTLSLRAKRRGDVLAAITHAVCDRLEGLKALPFEDAALSPGRYSETVRVEPGDCLVAETWEVADDGEGQKRVRMSVREAGRAGPKTVAILFISRGLGFQP
jgi:Tfp pilus assembly protein PilV